MFVRRWGASAILNQVGSSAIDAAVFPKKGLGEIATLPAEIETRDEESPFASFKYFFNSL
jgi:hypothetical protein